MRLHRVSVILALSSLIVAIPLASSHFTPGTVAGTFVGGSCAWDALSNQYIFTPVVTFSRFCSADLGRHFFADSQAHYGIPGELVEGGQLYLIASPTFCLPPDGLSPDVTEGLLSLELFSLVPPMAVWYGSRSWRANGRTDLRQLTAS